MAISIPHFLFVGTAKAGTTSIYNYLLQHDEIYLPKKETFYFLKDVYKNNSLPYPQQRPMESLVLNEEVFSKLHEDRGERLSGEVGTGYLYYHQEAIPHILKSFGEDTRILIILRNPVDRAFSSYNHFVKDLHEPLSFEESLEAESDRAQNGWDFMWKHKELGLYANQVKAYQDAFSHVKVLLYEQLITDSDQLMNEIFEFLNVAPLATLDTKKQFNPSGEAKSKWIQKLLIHDNPVKRIVRPVVRAVFSDDRRERMRKELKSRNLKAYAEMNQDTRKELLDFYRPDIELLEKLIEKDLSSWKL